LLVRESVVWLEAVLGGTIPIVALIKNALFMPSELNIKNTKYTPM
jgi:hypothetical protein